MASPKGIVSVGGVRSCSACLRSPPAQTVHRWSRVSACLYFMVPPLFPDPIQRFSVAACSLVLKLFGQTLTCVRTHTRDACTQPINSIKFMKEKNRLQSQHFNTEFNVCILFGHFIINMLPHLFIRIMKICLLPTFHRAFVKIK